MGAGFGHSWYGLGIWLLKKYDFAYQKKLLVNCCRFYFGHYFGGLLMDYLGLNDLWSRQGPMSRFYQQLDNQNAPFPRGQGQGRGE